MIELSDKEQAVLNAPVVETRVAMKEYERAQRALEGARQRVLVCGGAVDSVFRAVLTLKGVNPDAYTCEWSADSDEARVVPKVAELSVVQGDEQ